MGLLGDIDGGVGEAAKQLSREQSRGPPIGFSASSWGGVFLGEKPMAGRSGLPLALAPGCGKPGLGPFHWPSGAAWSVTWLTSCLVPSSPRRRNGWKFHPQPFIDHCSSDFTFTGSPQNNGFGAENSNTYFSLPNGSRHFIADLTSWRYIRTTPPAPPLRPAPF